MDLKPQSTYTGVTQATGEGSKVGQDVQYLKVACMQFFFFTWLWSSPQFCTRNREGVQKGQRGKRSLATLERRGRTKARN